MKLSKYSFVVKKDDVLLLYNCWSERLTVIQPELAALLKNGDINVIKKKHPTFYEYLLSEKYIIDNNVIEEKQIIEQWKSEENSPTSFSVFINPTLNCNMKCWYCYEEHRPKTEMNKDVFASVVALLKKQISDKQLIQFNLSFFGGEPLLEFEGTVISLIHEAEHLCKIYNKRFYLSFVTNGTLLDQAKIERLSHVKTNSPISFQITLDGDNRYHNATKKGEQFVNSYERTLANIKLLIKHKMFVTVRLNTTHYNINSYQNVIPEFDYLAEEERAYIKFDVQHVWQDSNYDIKDFGKKQTDLRNSLIEKGYDVSSLKRIDSSRCYADRSNCIVINYNGDLYKCTARDFISSNREGLLTKEGNIVWNEKYEKRNQIKYGNATCQACHIFPLCHGGCSQSKLDQEKTTGCLKGYNHNDKMKLIEDRLEFLLESIIKQIKR